MAEIPGKPLYGTRYTFGQKITAKEAFARQVKPGSRGLILAMVTKGIDRLVLWFEGQPAPIEIAASAFNTFCKEGWQ